MAELRCDLCESEPAVLMQTSLDNGDTIAVGGACLLTFALSFANSVAPNYADTDKAALGELVNALYKAVTGRAPHAAAAPKAAPRPKGAPRAGKRSAASVAPPETESGGAPDSAGDQVVAS